MKFLERRNASCDANDSCFGWSAEEVVCNRKTDACNDDTSVQYHSGDAIKVGKKPRDAPVRIITGSFGDPMLDSLGE